jgi:hypothetical protein
MIDLTYGLVYLCLFILAVQWFLRTHAVVYRMIQKEKREEAVVHRRVERKVRKAWKLYRRAERGMLS